MALLSACGNATVTAIGNTATAAATVKVGEEPLLQAPSRLGINLGQNAYYQDQQYVSNPLLHGGFAQGQQRTFIRTASGTANTVIDEYHALDDPDRSLAVSLEGGTYTIATGPRAGETGAIVAHDIETGAYTLEHSGAPIGEGEFLWLHGPKTARALPDPMDERIERGIGIGDFRVVADTEVALDFVPVEDDPNNQALRITFPATEGRFRGGLKHYIRPTPLTTYRVQVRARSAIPGAELGVSLETPALPGDHPGRNVTLRETGRKQLSPEWQDFLFEGFTASDKEVGDQFAPLQILVVANGQPGEAGIAEIDYVALEDENLAGETAFSAQVEEALKEARPGVLRFYNVANLGVSVEGFTAQSARDAGWAFLSLRSRFRMASVTAVADDWFKLAQQVESDPWITVGSSNTPAEWYDLISYIAAPADFDEHSARRARHGHEAPWIDAFDTVYLEIGNEWWNAIFRPYYVWSPQKYAELSSLIIEKVRSHPHFDDEKIQIVAGGWAVNAHHWNGIVDAETKGHDIVSLAPYLVHEMEHGGAPEITWGTLFAGVDGYRQGGGASTLKDFAENNSETRLAVYELNTHIAHGGLNDREAGVITASAAAGVGVLNQALDLMATMKTDPINYFVLLQRAYNNRPGLWGTLTRDYDGALRPRPTWQGLRLANLHAIEGDMVAVQVTGGPTWRQAENGSVPAQSAVPAVNAYAFRASDTQINLVLINRHWADTLTVALELPFRPATEATWARLGGGDPAANNEESLEVTLEEGTATISPDAPQLELPPVSATVYRITAP